MTMTSSSIGYAELVRNRVLLLSEEVLCLLDVDRFHRITKFVVVQLITDLALFHVPPVCSSRRPLPEKVLGSLPQKVLGSLLVYRLRRFADLRVRLARHLVVDDVVDNVIEEVDGAPAVHGSVVAAAPEGCAGGEGVVASVARCRHAGRCLIADVGTLTVPPRFRRRRRGEGKQRDDRQQSC